MQRFTDYMPCKYSSLKDLQDRLHGTICRFNGLPVYLSVESLSKINLFDVPTQSNLIKTLLPNDPRLDISMIELGYFNYATGGKRGATGNRVLYAKRQPSKKYKQGTCASYTQTFEIDGKRDGNYGGSAVMSKSFEDSILGLFPTIDQIEEFGGQMAISQDVAVEIDTIGILSVYYRTEKIAAKTPDGTVHLIKSDYSWVIERLLGGLI